MVIRVYRSEYQHTILKDAKVNIKKLLKNQKIVYEKTKKEYTSKENEIKLLKINFWNEDKVHTYIYTADDDYCYTYQKFAGIWFDYNMFWSVVLYGSLLLFAGLTVAMAVLKVVIAYNGKKTQR